MELNEEQQRIVKSDAPYIVVSAAAGSGKTRVLTERIKRALENGTNPKKMVAITFTNNAAEEMRERLGEKANTMFIGTIHSYANYLLMSRGLNTKDYLDQENFDELFRLVKKHPECVKEVEELYVDEAQDQSDEQYEFLLGVVRPKKWFFVGDVRQAIFGWAGANPDQLLHLMNRPEVTSFRLRNNYRCGSKILDFAKSLIRLAGTDYADDSISVTKKLGRVQDVEYNASLLAQGIKKTGEPWNDWFVLCRTNDEIDYFCKELKDIDVPYDTFKRKDLTKMQLQSKLSENTVKVLTIHSAKGLEAKKVAVIGARFYNTEERCISYVAATRAKELLVWARIPQYKKKIATGYHMNVRNWE